jgi:peptidase E
MTLFLAGGGSATQEAQVWRRACSNVERLLYWPFALPDDRVSDAEAWLLAGLEELGIDLRVETWECLDGHSTTELGRHDLLFVGGGTTSKLAAHIRENEFEQAVRDFVAGGGRYYGGSAGALLACEWISIAALLEKDPDALGMQGLGLIPGFSIFPHADKYPAGRPAEVAEKLGHEVLVLPEASGVVVDGDSLRAIGPDTVQIASPYHTQILSS